jgi:peroxiredoxin
MTLRLTPRRASALAMFSLGLAACGAASPESAAAPGAARAEGAGSRAPDFELDTLDGRSVRLSDHFGKDVVLIDFWATFCDPCLAAMPHLDELYRKHKARGFVILGVSIDGPDSVAQVRAEVNKLAVTFPILLDEESQVVALYNPKTSAPYSVLIGRDGRVLSKKEGYTTGDASVVERDIEAALAR